MDSKQLAPEEDPYAKNQSESLRENKPGRAGTLAKPTDAPAACNRRFPGANNNDTKVGNTWDGGDNPGKHNLGKNNGAEVDNTCDKTGDPDTTNILTDRLMTYQDLACFTQIPLPTLKAKKDLIPHFKFGKAVRFYKPDIILWLQTKHMVRPIEIDNRPTSKDHILREIRQGKEVV